MRKLTSIIALILACSLYTNIDAQDFSSQLNYIESIEEDLNIEELIDVWEYYAQNKINLSKKEQIDLLSNLLLLSRNEIELITIFCKSRTLNSIYQLQVLDLQISSLKRIKPFITSSSKEIESKQQQKSTLYLGIQFQHPKKEGMLNNSYIGSAYKNQIRYRTSLNNNWKIGLNIEKDIGEPLWYKKSGLNNFAFNLIYKGAKKLKQLNIGKYDISIAEGLLFGTSYRINSPYFLSYNTSTIVKSSLSPKEYNYFEGVTVKWKLKELTLDVFSSIRKPNGTTSYDKTGLFRTDLEIKKHKRQSEQLIGVHILKDQKQNRFTWAGILYKSDLLEKRISLLQSYYFMKSYYNIQISAELANQNFKVWAGLIKLNISIGKSSFITIQCRNRNAKMLNEFNADYSSYSNGYEKGIYTAFQHQLNRNWKLRFAVDYFKANQQQKTSPHYPEGNKIFNELSRTTDETRFVVQYQFKQIKESNNIQKFRLYYQQEMSPQLRWSSKIYCISEQQKLNSSIQFNLILKSENQKISFSNCFFNTQNEAIYWQAPHFYGSYNARFLSGKGSTYSLSIQKRVLTNLKLGAQATFLNYIDRVQIGTGNETIDSNNKLDFALYIKWKN